MNNKNKKGHSSGKCPVSGSCGGCKYLNKTYEEQLLIKRDYVAKLLKEFGEINEVIGMDKPYHYRNKVNAVFHHKRNGEIVAGRYEEGTHNVVTSKDCLIEDKKSQEIIESVRGLLKSFKITVYNEDTGYGLLRHVMIRTGYATGEIMVVLVTSSPIFPSKKNFCKALLKLHPDITTIVQNINEKATSMVLGERNQTLYGKGYIEDRLCGKIFKLSPTSFYQINPVQTEILYNKAVEYAGLTGNETVIDAYCGTGTIGIVAADNASKVIGVELNKAAVKDAIINIKRNGSKNVNIYQDDAGKFMVKMAARGEHADVVFMDPPRNGSNKAFLDSVIKLNPRSIVYVSCGPDSLARDIQYVLKNGKYVIIKIAVVDMFPWTESIETVVKLVRKKAC